MGYYEESLFGIDMNLDGRTDWKDDILISTMMVEENAKRSEIDDDPDWETDD